MSAAEIEKKLQEFKPSLRESSVKAYARNIAKMISKNVNLKSLDSIQDFLKDYKSTTRANYYSSLSVYSKMNKEPEDFVDEIEKLRNKEHSVYSEDADNHTKSEKQEKNWMPWDDIEKLAKEMYDKALKIGKDNKGVELTMQKRMDMQDALLVNLYTRLQMRNDIANMKVLSVTEHKNLDPKYKTSKNFLVMKPSKPYLELNHYKTSRKYGSKKFDIPEEIVPLLKSWLRYNKTGFLFVNTKDQPMSSNAVSKNFIRIFNKHTGKNISTSMLRHIYLSDKYQPVTDEKKRDADIMMHSTMMQNGYIKKDED